jgi:hypothetical protein
MEEERITEVLVWLIAGVVWGLAIASLATA